MNVFRARVSCQRSYGAREHKIPPKNFNHFFSGSPLVKTSKSIVILSLRASIFPSTLFSESGSQIVILSLKASHVQEFVKSFLRGPNVQKLFTKQYLNFPHFLKCSKKIQVFFEGSRRPESFLLFLQLFLRRPDVQRLYTEQFLNFPAHFSNFKKNVKSFFRGPNVQRASHFFFTSF